MFLDMKDENLRNKSILILLVTTAHKSYAVQDAIARILNCTHQIDPLRPSLSPGQHRNHCHRSSFLIAQECPIGAEKTFPCCV